MKVKLSQIKFKKCYCGMRDHETGVECEACPFDSSFSRIHFMTKGYFCKIDDFKNGLIDDQEIIVETDLNEFGNYDENYRGNYEEHIDFNKNLLNYLEIVKEE